MNGFGLSASALALLFSVMLVAGGNTAMQSLLPAIAAISASPISGSRSFSLSACIWVVTAPYWAHRADQQARALMRIGLYGYASRC